MDNRSVDPGCHTGTVATLSGQKIGCGTQIIAVIGTPSNLTKDIVNSTIEKLPNVQGGCEQKLPGGPPNVVAGVPCTQMEPRSMSLSGDPTPGMSSESPRKLSEAEKIHRKRLKMMRKDALGLSNEAWARRLAFTKHPNMLARPNNPRELSLLQDQDVPDLTESLTKTLVHGDDRKGDPHGNEALDSLAEIDEDDLAMFLPDVASSSDSETGAFPHNYVDIIGEQFGMESLDAITNIAATCSSGGNGADGMAPQFQAPPEKPAMLPDTTNSNLLPLEPRIDPKTLATRPVIASDLRPCEQIQKVSSACPSDNARFEASKIQTSQSCEVLPTQSHETCEVIASPVSDEHDNNNLCSSSVPSNSPCCDTLSYNQSDSHCYLDTSAVPTSSTCNQPRHEHDLLKLDSVSNVSPDSGILSISESPMGQEAPSPYNPTTTHHPTLSPQSVFIDSVSSPRQLDYLPPEADSTEDNRGYHSDVNDEPPQLIPMYDHSSSKTAKKRGPGRPRKHPPKPDKAITTPPRRSSSEQTVSEALPIINVQHIAMPGTIPVSGDISGMAGKNVIKPDLLSQPKKRGPGRPKGSGDKSRKKAMELMLGSVAGGNSGNIVGSLPKPKGRPRKAETVKALLAMAEEARRNAALMKKCPKETVSNIPCGYINSDEICDEEIQVKKKVRKPVSSKVLASGLKATTDIKPLPKVQKPVKLPKAPKKSVTLNDFRSDKDVVTGNSKDLGYRVAQKCDVDFVVRTCKESKPEISSEAVTLKQLPAPKISVPFTPQRSDVISHDNSVPEEDKSKPLSPVFPKKHANRSEVSNSVAPCVSKASPRPVQVENPVKKRRGPGRPRKHPIPIKSPGGPSKLISSKTHQQGPLSDSSRKSAEDGDTFASLIRSVNASINSQFRNQTDDNEDLSDLSLNTSGGKEQLSVPQSVHTKITKIKAQKQSKPKPKTKKPKIHVMMRRTKRRRRKKKICKPELSESLSVETDLGSAGTDQFLPCQENNSVGLLMVAPSTSTAVSGASDSPPSPKMPSAGPGEEKTKDSSKEETEGSFGSSIRLGCDSQTEDLSKTLLPSSSGSAAPPPKLQLPPPCEKPHSKPMKKKVKLKVFKSKHKNIIDPVFLEDVDEMSEQLEKLVLDLDSSWPQNVESGEKPMPDIFRKQTYVGRKRKKEWYSIHKQQNKEVRKPRDEVRKVKERDKKPEKPKETDQDDPVVEATEPVPQEKPQKMKGKKAEGRKRKRSISESEVVVQKPAAVSPPELVEHNEQCLPLKKRHKLFTAASEGEQSVESSPVESSPPSTSPDVVPPKRKVGRPRKKLLVEDKTKPETETAVVVVDPPENVKPVITPEKKTSGRRPKVADKSGVEKASPEQTVAKPAEILHSMPETPQPPKPKVGRPRKKKDVSAPMDSEQKDGANQDRNSGDDQSENTSNGTDKTPASNQSGPIKKRSPGRPRKNFGDGGKKGSGDDDKSPERPRKIEKNTAPCVSPERPEKESEKKSDIAKNLVSEGTQVSVDEGVQADTTQVSEGTQSDAPPVVEEKKLITSSTQTCDDDFTELLPSNRVEKDVQTCTSDVQTCTSASQTQTVAVGDDDPTIVPKFQKEFEQFLSSRTTKDDKKSDGNTPKDSVTVKEADEAVISPMKKDGAVSVSVEKDSVDTVVTSKDSVDTEVTSKESGDTKVTSKESVDTKVTSKESVDTAVISKGSIDTEVTSKDQDSSSAPIKSSNDKRADSGESDVEIVESVSVEEPQKPKKSSLKKSGAGGRRRDLNKVVPILEKMRTPEHQDMVVDDDGCVECSKLQDSEDKPPNKKRKYTKSDAKTKSSVNSVKFTGLPKTKTGRKYKPKPGRKKKKSNSLPAKVPPKTGRGRKSKRKVGRPKISKSVKNSHVDKKSAETVHTGDSSEYSCESDYAEEPRVDSKSLTREYHPLPSPTRKRKRKNSVDEKVIPKKRRKKSGDGSAIPGRDPKKRFQKAGLFSDCYKDPSLSSKKPKVDEPAKDNQAAKPKSMYVPNEHEHGLMPMPIHVGKYMVEKKSDFQLPYDIWWLHSSGQMQKNNRPVPKYRKIRNNVYIDIKPACPYEHNPCTCIAPTVYNNLTFGCGEDCLNRMVYTECSPSICPSKDKCSNMRLQKHEWAPGLHLYFSGDRGYGVKCKNAIQSGQFIIEYVGEVVSEHEFKTRMTQSYSNERHHYCLNLDSGTVIDGYRMGSLCRFVNHSCEPNCEMQKWNVNGLYRIGLFSLRDIPANEELSYDYNFHNYNLEQQQECKCGSEKCRGTIGGKAQRINGVAKDKNVNSRPIGRPNNDKRKSKSKLKKVNENEQAPYRSQYLQPMKPMSHRERCFIQKHNISLLRNLEKVRRIRQRMLKSCDEKKEDAEYVRERPINQKDVFMSQFMALKTPRSVKTRRLALAEEDSGVTRTAKLAQVLKDIFSAVAYCKDEDGNNIATPLMTLPPRKSHPAYYKVIKELITLATIEQKILSGQFATPEPFEKEMLTLFRNVEIYCGKKSEMGQKVKHLRKVFFQARAEAKSRIEEIIGSDQTYPAASEADPSEADTESRHPEDDEDEDIIRCICGIFKDEGLMIQCEKCMVWQHCDCMRVSGDEENYLCEECDARPVDKEVPFTESDSSTPPEHTQYMTLLREDLLIRLGDCVYITKQKSIGDEPPLRTSFQTVENVNPDDLDIFRIEQLWIDEKNEKFAYGHIYLRPQETFHEPSRKFFANEVFRVPYYEIIPLKVIVGTCYVLDLATFCKGRPKSAKEEHIYICEYRLDKTAHVFYKISRSKYPTNTKSYCFDSFEKKLQPKRTFIPHTVPDNYKRKGSHSDTMSTTSGDLETFQSSDGDNEEDSIFKDESKVKKVMKNGKESDTDSDEDLPLARVREKKRQQRKDRLNTILLKLLGNMPGKQAVDLTYLLDEGRGKRARKKSHLLMP